MTAEHCAHIVASLAIDPDGDHEWPADLCMEYNRALANAAREIRAYPTPEETP